MSLSSTNTHTDTHRSSAVDLNFVVLDPQREIDVNHVTYIFFRSPLLVIVLRLFHNVKATDIQIIVAFTIVCFERLKRLS